MRRPAPPPFPWTMFVLVMCITLIGVGSVTWGTLRANAALVDAKDRYAEIQRLSADILLYDEMLTMSARQAVAEGLVEQLAPVESHALSLARRPVRRQPRSSRRRRPAPRSARGAWA